MEEQQVVSTQQESMITVIIRIPLKPERVEETQGDAGAAAFVELVVNTSQPVTIDLAESKVAITLHGHPATAAPAA
ncbi:MAG TPA: hypothetical protein VGG03_00675 [Thermoanaerobaculia bacterium]|jgi:hypothetical protein